MALTAAFSISTDPDTPTQFRITDSSTGTDGLVTSRRVYITNSDGDYVVPSGTTTDYVLWAYADSFIDIDVLDEDMALDIRVDWLNSVNVALYTVSNVYAFVNYLEAFLYSLTQLQASKPSLAQSNGWYDYKMQVRTEVDGAENAITIGADIFSSQSCIERAQLLLDKQAIYF